MRIVSGEVPNTLILYFFKMPCSSKASPQLRAVCPPKESSMLSIGQSFFSFLMISSITEVWIDKYNLLPNLQKSLKKIKKDCPNSIAIFWD